MRSPGFESWIKFAQIQKFRYLAKGDGLKLGAIVAVAILAGQTDARTAIKLDGRSLGGSVRYWAHVNQFGQVLSGSRGARAFVAGAQYTVTWGTDFSSRCAPLVTSAAVPGIAPLADSTGVGINQPGRGKGKTVVYVWTYNHGIPTQSPFYIAVVC